MHRDYPRVIAWRKANPERYRAQNRRGRLRAIETNRQIINDAKSVPCLDCKETFPTYVMDFDHVRGVKVSDVSQMLRESTEALLAEIAKCDVVCANCHRKRTHERTTERMKVTA